MNARLLVLVLLLQPSCATAPPRVALSNAWPTTAPSYSEAQRRWTRRASHSADWTLVIDVAATLESAEWRAAYTRERARRLRLPKDEEARLAAEQQAQAAEAWEIELIVSTAKPEWNDFRKGTASMWRVALVGDDGREVTPISIGDDPRPRAALEGWFGLQPFYQAYVVKFPKNGSDGQPLAQKRLALKVSGPRGAVEMVWSE